MSGVCFYISGHGFGHASRQIEIINALGPLLPADCNILIRSTAAPRLFERTLDVPFTVLPGETDTGVIQFDSLRLDEAETVARAREFYASLDVRAEQEARVLRQHGVELVVCDAPPLACAAARAAGIPSVVISNFTWDWIYEGYADRFTQEAPDVLPVIREAYRSAREGWRLPMHGGFAEVPVTVDLPFVARRAKRSRDEVLAALNLPSDRPLVLSSFGGFGVKEFDLSTLDCRDAYTVIITRWQEEDRPPEGVRCVDEWRMYEMGFRYEDLVAAVDIVATKPGYGIISECIANDTAMLYTSRGRFVEYDVLVREMPRYLQCRYLDQGTLLAGRWQAALDNLMNLPPPPERLATDGAELAARRLAGALRVRP